LSASSLRVGVCDDLELDAGASSGSGGRALTFVYSVAPASAAATATIASGETSAVSDAFKSLRNVTAWLEAANGNRVTLPSAFMPRATAMAFTLTVSNFLGYSRSTTIVVSKLGIPVPVLKIQVSFFFSNFLANVSPFFSLSFSPSLQLSLSFLFLSPL